MTDNTTESTETHTPDAAGRTLHIRLLGDDEHSHDLTEIASKLDTGEEIEARSDPVLRVESVATLGRVLRGTNLELLDAIAATDPGSIRALARTVDRGPKEVLQNLNELQDYGLVAFERAGRAKRPYLPYDEIDIRLPFPHSDEAGTVAASSA